MSNTLCLVTDSSHLKGRKLVDVVHDAIEGGVNMVQLREKYLSTREFVALAREVKRVTDDYNVPFIINDRMDVAMAVDADGIHIGQTDMPYAIARAILGREKIIGITVENTAQLMAANDLSVDYVGISPIFATPTSNSSEGPCGIDGLVRATQFSLHPVIAIGGINQVNAGQVIRAIRRNTPQRTSYHTNNIESGIAVISAIMAAPSALLAAKDLKQQMK